jgi:hypothetical protein
MYYHAGTRLNSIVHVARVLLNVGVVEEVGRLAT